MDITWIESIVEFFRWEIEGDQGEVSLNKEATPFLILRRNPDRTIEISASDCDTAKSFTDDRRSFLR
jgi:hypothetical protein